MTASSVTGIGQGSADKAGQKGSEHLFVGVEKLIGTRVVMAGFATLVSASPSTVVVELPENLPGIWNQTFDDSIDAFGVAASSDYVVLLQPFNPTQGQTFSVSAMSTSGNQTFTIKGPNTVTTKVFWMIVRRTSASVTAFPTHR